MCKDESYFYEMLNDVKQKILILGENSYILKALENNLLNEIESDIKSKPENELEHSLYPPLFLFVYRNNINALKELEKDIQLIKIKSTKKSFNDLINFLQAKSKETRKWASHLFELSIKSILLKKFSNELIEFDKKLPNEKDIDASLNLNNQIINFEVTLLSSSNYDYNAYNKYVEELKNNPHAVFMRPGKYYENYPNCPLLKYDEFRVLRKVYDKITDEELNIDKSKMSEDQINILLLFIGDSISPLQYSPGIGWAFDELFADQPKGNENDFIKWINIEINNLKLDHKWYCENLDKVIFAPRKLSGVIIFNGCNGDIIESRVNYNAHNKNKISHKLMAEVEEIFKEMPIYISQKQWGN